MGNIVKICDKCNRVCVVCDKDSIIDDYNNCGGNFVDTGIKFEEWNVIDEISHDRSFLDAMIQLKKENIIEYNLKMAQFKATLSQQNAEENAIKCPRCGSTNIQMVPRKFSLLTGFMTNKVDRVCMNCKHKF